MKRAVRLTEAAEQDLNLARQWYLQQAPHMEAALEEELGGTFQSIAERPRLYQSVEGTVHRAPLSRFPLSIYYREVADWIEVIAVIHQARDPRRWQRRIP